MKSSGGSVTPDQRRRALPQPWIPNGRRWTVTIDPGTAATLTECDRAGVPGWKGATLCRVNCRRIAAAGNDVGRVTKDALERRRRQTRANLLHG